MCDTNVGCPTQLNLSDAETTPDGGEIEYEWTLVDY